MNHQQSDAFLVPELEDTSIYVSSNLCFFSTRSELHDSRTNSYIIVAQPQTMHVFCMAVCVCVSVEILDTVCNMRWDDGCMRATFFFSACQYEHAWTTYSWWSVIFSKCALFWFLPPVLTCRQTSGHPLVVSGTSVPSRRDEPFKLGGASWSCGMIIGFLHVWVRQNRHLPGCTSMESMAPYGLLFTHSHPLPLKGMSSNSSNFKKVCTQICSKAAGSCTLKKRVMTSSLTAIKISRKNIFFYTIPKGPQFV